MGTIIAYRRLIEDEDDQRSLKWIINCKLVFNYHYASYFYKKVAQILVDIFVTWQTNSMKKKQNLIFVSTKKLINFRINLRNYTGLKKVIKW